MNSNHLEPIEPKRIDYLLHQQSLYQAAKPELLEQYDGQYIAFENGNILDAIIGRDVLNQCLVEFDGLLGEVRL